MGMPFAEYEALCVFFLLFERDDSNLVRIQGKEKVQAPTVG